MEFINRVWNSIKLVASGITHFVVSPFVVAAAVSKEPISAFGMFTAYVGCFMRVLAVLSWFVAVPSFMLGLAVIWLTISFTSHLVVMITGVVAICGAPSKQEEELVNGVAA